MKEVYMKLRIMTDGDFGPTGYPTLHATLEGAMGGEEFWEYKTVWETKWFLSNPGFNIKEYTIGRWEGWEIRRVKIKD